MGQDHDIKALFAKFLEDRCTAAETERIIAYLQSSPSADDIPSVEEVKAKINNLPTIDPQRAEVIFENIIASQHQVEPNIRNTRIGNHRPYWLAAASLAGILLIASYWYLNAPSLVEYATEYSSIRHITLPDSTQVVLNANSTLSHAETWKSDQREVWLSGEAYFSVTHSADGSKFLVHTDQALRVEVLGTQFNVHSRQGETTVVLNNGKIKINVPENDEVSHFMEPGDLLAYEQEGQTLHRQKVDTSYYTAWVNNLLVFQENTLAEIAQTISNNHGYRVAFANDSLATLEFTGASPADDIELLLQTLSWSFNLDIKREDGQIYIEEKEPISVPDDG